LAPTWFGAHPTKKPKLSPIDQEPSRLRGLYAKNPYNKSSYAESPWAESPWAESPLAESP
jgi:hypothetical protein